MKFKLCFVGLLLTLIITTILLPISVFANEPQIITASWEHIAPEPMYFATSARVNLRPTPSTSGESIMVVAVGESVLVLDFLCGEWYAVLYNGIRGYMYAEFLPTPDAPPEPSVLSNTWDHIEIEPLHFITTARLNLRATPSTAGDRILVVSEGRRVDVLDTRCGEWFEVSYGGNRGFMYAEFLRDASTVRISGNVEKLEWRDAQNLVTHGRIFTVVDVRTGISWEMASFSNGNHADVEPITANDTAAMLRAFGQWTWTPRPVHVVVGGRTIAASINGMPHAGSTRSENNMDGHVCLHFLGSTTHTTNAPGHARNHQDAVAEAFRAGQ
ncbi:MAG: SH3 domain-containing protein [Defluviitaleaceae bacterium]|nr:SH3 domain-containing protein [Defluviitaleaceae bacterium]